MADIKACPGTPGSVAGGRRYLWRLSRRGRRAWVQLRPAYPDPSMSWMRQAGRCSSGTGPAVTRQL
jgi:hypothetical protein